MWLKQIPEDLFVDKYNIDDFQNLPEELQDPEISKLFQPRHYEAEMEALDQYF